MASTTLTFCSTFTSTARLSQKQIHSSRITTTLCLSKTNFSFLSPTTPSLSSQNSTLSPIISTRSTSSTIPKSFESEAPVLDSEIVTADFEPAQIVETSDLAPKREEIFAVVMVGSRQYIVFPGRFIYTQRLKGANVDDKIILNKVLLVGTKTSAYIGKPVVPYAAVHAVVEEQGLNPKVVVFKYKKKKNYRRNIGHRQPNTRIRITGITGYENSPVVTLDS